jgi:hypothetical protein
MRVRKRGRGDIFGVALLLEAERKVAVFLPLGPIGYACAPQLGAVAGSRRVREARLGDLNTLINLCGSYVNDIRATVERSCVAAASEQHDVLTPKACSEATCEKSFAGCRRGHLVQIADDEMLGGAARFRIDVQIRVTNRIVGDRSKDTGRQRPTSVQFGRDDSAIIFR